MKNSGQLNQILKEALKREPKGRFLFLTLTAKNAEGAVLKPRLREMGRAVYKLFQYKRTAKNLLGYVRSTEVTVNDDGPVPVYHYHMHVLIFVKSTYFRADQYITQADWTKFWQRAMKLDYQPVVNVKAVHPHPEKNKNSLLASAQETAKYQVKSADILTNEEGRDLQVIDDLEQGLAGTRQISYGGLLKQIRKELQLEDAENGDLVNTDNGDDETGEVVREVIAKWNAQRQNYYVM